MKNAFEILGKSFQVDIDQDGVIGAAFSDEPTQPKNDELYDQALREMHEYAEGKRKVFSLPLHPKGTPFQLKVWNALLEIPYGETRTYGQIAKAIGMPKASRAVGGACNRNPIGIIIPCHRVIGSDGKLTGYYGGLEYKELLLKHEKRWTE
jgi:methylated-DNA-[protein]-cysteine S-methyltransferase